MAGSRKRIWLATLLLLPGSLLLGVGQWFRPQQTVEVRTPTPIELPTSEGMIRLPGGVFLMGTPLSSDDSLGQRDSQPLHQVRLDPFWLDARSVTNHQFETFVQQTGYETEAERRGSSLIFDRKLKSWREVVGVNWRRPEGPDSSLVGKRDYPVVHVTWRDAATYADWANKRLPTEAEFEFAARGGLSDCRYPWGRQLRLDQQYLANSWQGHFPDEDNGVDGFRGIAPVAQFPPNRFGLYDMAGNVWHWCFDWYSPTTYGASLGERPQGPNTGERRVRRGGSWLSAANYAGNLRVDFRDHASPNESTNHTSFRCARSVITR
ncbi:MAG: formylglycine-generating enzyme family protein [Planctomycetota bacterium]